MTGFSEVALRAQVLTFTIPATIHAPVTATDRQHPGLWWVECSGCSWLGRSSWGEIDALTIFREHKDDLTVEAVRRRTGAGKLDAVKALTSAGGDVAAAIDSLHKESLVHS